MMGRAGRRRGRSRAPLVSPSAACLLIPLALSACGTPDACLANRYDGSAPQARCVSGLQLPFGLLKDTDPMSGSTAPVDPAL